MITRAKRLHAALLLALCALACRHAPPAAPATPSSAPPTAAAAAPRPAAPDRPWTDEILYFVLVDRFADGDPANDVKVDRSAPGAFHGGDLAGLTAHLDEIASLGVTAIWVNPLVKNIDGFVSGAGFPDWAYHGYWADDFTRLDRRFGTAAELDRFVDECHRRGIRVLLDVVYNHAGYDSAYLRDPKTRAWLRTADGTCGDDDLTTCLAGLPDFKTERPDVRDFLMGVQLGWAKRSGVDGFRLDTVKHVEHDFWQEHRRRVRAELGPRFFLLGEVFGADAQSISPYFDDGELDAAFDFSFQGSTVGWLQGRGRTIAYERYLEKRKVAPGHLLAHFLSSHDVPGALHLLGGDRTLFGLAAVLQLTTAGLPTIFYGEEVARDVGEWPRNRSDMPWGDRAVEPGHGVPRDEALRALYTRLIAIRRGHPALSRGAHEALFTDGDLLAFVRRDASAGDAVVVAVNRGAASARARIARPAEWAGRAPADLLAGAPLAPEAAAGQPDGAIDLEVPARAARILGVQSKGAAPPGDAARK